MSTPNIENQNSEMPSSFFDDVKEQHNQEPATVLGKYQIIRELGQGGMGKVYLCYDNILNRHVAIKVILSQYKERAKKRFLIEAQAIANLSHPNIIKIYELGFTSSGNPYMVMEYVAGCSLKEFMANNKLSVREKVALIMPIADALAHAHRKGIIHRDVKPSNILIDTDNNHGYLMDFGLAKMANVNQELTKTGSVLGSPRYMSPEQARGRSREIDTQTDIYSLGITFFEIISGSCPVQGGSSMEVVVNVIHKNIPPLRKVFPQAPRDLETICLKALQKHKSKRYSHMATFKNDLQLFYENKPINARRWHLYSWGIWLVTLLIVLVTAITYYSFSTSQMVPEGAINESATQIEHYLQQQMYSEANDLLETVRTEISQDAYSFYLARISSGMGQQQKFNFIYKRLPKEEKDNIKIILAKVHVSILGKESTEVWEEARRILRGIDPQKLARRDRALRLFYLLQMEQNKDKILAYCLELEELENVLLNHEKLQVYNSLVKQFMRIALKQNGKQKIDTHGKIIKYAKQSIAIEENINVYLSMAKAYYEKANYQEKSDKQGARRNYQNLTDTLRHISRLDRLNQEMFSYYTKLATGDFVRYKSLLFEVIAAFSMYNFQLPDPKKQFIPHTTSTWPVKPKSTSDTKVIRSLISKSHMAQAKQGLFVERYHPKMAEILTKSSGKKAKAILTSIERLKAIDREQWISGLIRELNKETHSTKITELKTYLEINDQQLVKLLMKIFKNPDTPTIRRYMVAKALIGLLQFPTIVQYVKNSSDQEMGLISAVVLRDMGFDIPQKTFKKCEKTCFTVGNEFLQYLLTQLYTQQKKCPPRFITDIIEKGHPINKIYIASFCVKHRQRNRSLYKWSYEFLQKTTQTNNPNELRCLAYYFFVTQNKLSQKMWKDLQNTLSDKSEDINIKLSILKAIAHIVEGEHFSKNFILQDQTFWANFVAQNNNQLLHTIALRLFNDKNLKDYAKNTDYNYWLRGYAYFIYLHRFNTSVKLGGIGNAFDTLQKFMQQRQYVKQVFIENKPDILLRGYAYMLLGFMGEEPLRYIQTETDPLAKSYILLSCTVPAPSFVPMQRFSPKKRLALMKKYMLSENKIINSSSSYAYGHISNRLTAPHRKVNNTSFAAGIFAHIERGKKEQALLWQYGNPDYDKNMFRYYAIQRFYSRAETKANEYIKRLQKLIEMDNTNAKYNFYIGMAYKQQKKWKRAQHFFRKALSKKKDIFIMLELLSCLYYRQQKFSSSEVNKDVNSLLETILHTLKKEPVTGAALLPIITMQNPKVEKILQQNLASLLLKQNASRKRLLIIALEVLQDFYQRNNKKFKHFDTYIGWLK
ncbi:serine/threonine-protein kinase [Candidatus Uabimicrobium amorphum]|uniref:Protein kinase n=1 Tax=Uabimicrobium amorphum TaxID=2596890 RepID=A0A5S9IQF4_UABAM|nr:serine/threonine-protein kinase [Candidatus Uabimicrobium amorphum]BBM86004.1 protein kinase [Candidatus Uabimicrobium amorphum]